MLGQKAQRNKNPIELKMLGKKKRRDGNSIENEIGYNFHNPNILTEALSHSSTQKLSNERLEFLGDAVLELIISEHIFKYYSFDEGDMSQKRSLIVKKESLYQAARLIKLSSYMYFGKSELMAGGPERPSILANAFEALIGAIYLDGGYLSAKKFIFRFLGEKIEEVVNQNVVYDYKTSIADYLKKQGIKRYRYVLYKEEGPQHDKMFYVYLRADGENIGRGKGKTKKHAEQEAARDAIENLNEK
ncbi:MAG: ribonuclease III [Eubacteriales bacterium]